MVLESVVSGLISVSMDMYTHAATEKQRYSEATIPSTDGWPPVFQKIPLVAGSIKPMFFLQPSDTTVLRIQVVFFSIRLWSDGQKTQWLRLVQKFLTWKGWIIEGYAKDSCFRTHWFLGPPKRPNLCSKICMDFRCKCWWYQHPRIRGVSTWTTVIHLVWIVNHLGCCLTGMAMGLHVSVLLKQGVAMVVVVGCCLLCFCFFPNFKGWGLMQLPENGCQLPNFCVMVQ